VDRHDAPGTDTDAGDAIWDAVVEALLSVGPAREQASRYGNKPAVMLGRREVAHYEGGGVVDLRITAAGWREVPSALAADQVIHRDRGRRDWIELHMSGPEDVRRLARLFVILNAHNQGVSG
jgi:hypothetical protein